MGIEYHFQSPFRTYISFHKLIESYEKQTESTEEYRAAYANSVLAQIEKLPELKSGVDDLVYLEKNAGPIKKLLSDLFPEVLTNNEIKAATIPFQNITFNNTERYKRIIKDAGFPLEIQIRNFDQHQFYISSCSMILNAFYKQNIDFSKPIFYDIPDASGTIRHYKILYNADFVEIYPTEKSPNLTQEDINDLIDNYDDLELWQRHFPVDSWILKGFVIATLVDVTTENAISNLKSTLLMAEQGRQEEELQAIFQSFLKVSDTKIGFTQFVLDSGTFKRPPMRKGNFKSFLLNDFNNIDCNELLCSSSFDTLITQGKSLVISDVRKYGQYTDRKKLAEHLLSQGVESCIVVPIKKDDVLIGVIEVASTKPRQLNSIVATKLDLIIPFLVDTIEKTLNELKNLEEAIIQKEYTAIHPSVYWKFKREAQQYIDAYTLGEEYVFKEITFKDVLPLYGQIDISGSSTLRNDAIEKDLTNQVSALVSIFEHIDTAHDLMILEQKEFELREMLEELSKPLKTDTELQIQAYLEQEIHPILKINTANSKVAKEIKSYFEKLDKNIGMFYHSRKDFDRSLSLINKKLADVIDRNQTKAQAIYPHYYERFKTDGVEHNLYIGASIAPHIPFDSIFLGNLRLWQLQTLCEMAMEHQRIESELPVKLEVASLILVYSTPIAVRFRMDEKRFDIDGSYNARYEVVKKRIDKAHIFGTNERITAKGKITIVYSGKTEEAEYQKYIKFLQHKNILDKKVEQFDIEDLQGVSGLRALRVKVATPDSLDRNYTYSELLKELN